MVTLTIAGQTVNFGNLGNAIPTQPLSDKGQTRTVTGTTSSSYSYATDKSLQQNAFTFSNILQGKELPETYRESVTTRNLLNLGQSSRDISNALSVVSQNLQNQINGLKSSGSSTIQQEVPKEEGSIQDNFSNVLSKIKPYAPLLIIGGGALLVISLAKRR